MGNMIFAILGFSLFYFLICWFISTYAEGRNINSVLVFFLSFLFTPIVGIIALVVSDKKQVKGPSRVELQTELLQLRQLKEQNIITSEQMVKRESEINKQLGL